MEGGDIPGSGSNEDCQPESQGPQPELTETILFRYFYILYNNIFYMLM